MAKKDLNVAGALGGSLAALAQPKGEAIPVPDAPKIGVPPPAAAKLPEPQDLEPVLAIVSALPPEVRRAKTLSLRIPDAYNDRFDAIAIALKREWNLIRLDKHELFIIAVERLLKEYPDALALIDANFPEFKT
ncbi:hypothetical protein GE253_23005 [Niveispirillum sp. SYP-B3756]|uniref:hypothetical protein n=1 Tax=Niveispirillum sp. SYP-B3756 TaxID=2662178 RepID=UPI0012912EB2|nr:hypothetical protein [Niveispirillum sp. SYP-B3756]MQP68191.1 hypothetical protein [Niveispirillum sp. SYP-B3756]